MARTKKSPLVALVRAEALEEHTMRKCKSGRAFPKNMRAGLPQRMENEAVDAVAYIMDANDYDLRDPEEVPLRLCAQRDALRELRKLLHHIELAYTMGYINADEFEHWSGLAIEALSKTAAWHKVDKQRLKN